MIVWRIALEQVLYLQKFPKAVHAMRQAPLPDGIASIMRLASDSGSLLSDAANELGMDSALLQMAVSEYLIAICLFPSSNARRMLGLNVKSSPETAREHYRLLLKWLHPDKTQQHKNYAERVNQAWAILKAREWSNDQPSFAPATSAQRPEPRQLRTSRFPLFVIVLLCLALGLLAIAFLPDNTVYVSGVDGARITNEQSTSSEIPAELEAALIDRINNAVVQLKPAEQAVVAVQAVKPIVGSSAAIQSVPKLQIQVEIQNNKGSLIRQQGPVEAKIKQPDVKPVAPIQAQIVAGAEVALKNAPVGISMEQGLQFINDYAQRYQKGDIDYFMQLFSTTAHDSNGDRDAIEQDYRKFFENSLDRQIKFSRLQWHSEKQNALTMHAMYDTKIKWHKMWDKIRFANSSAGQIELNLIEENGKVRIQQILIKE